VIPAILILLLILGISGGVRARNIELCWFFLPIGLQIAFLFVGNYWSGPKNDSVASYVLAVFGAIELLALSFSIFRARRTMWSGLCIAAVCLFLGFAGLTLDWIPLSGRVIDF
jgi:hypothetical protein